MAFPRANQDAWVPKAVSEATAWTAKAPASAEKSSSYVNPYDNLPPPKPKVSSLPSPFDNLPPPKRPKKALESDFKWPTGPSTTSDPAATAASSTDSPKASSPAAAKEATAAEKRDEIIETAPRLAEHIKSGNTTKFNKVATMASTLLESGRVSAYNSSAFYDILEAGVADAARIRAKDTRAALRSLYAAALAKQDVFSTKHQAMLRLWHMRVVNQIDLQTLNDQFARIAKEIRTGLLMLPCVNPSMEPPTRSGAPREHLPEAARRMWADALYDCLEVAHERYNKRDWAQSDVNMIVKGAHDRRQNFTEAQAKKIQGWEQERRDSARLDATGFKPATKS